MANEPSIFERIVAGEIPSYKLYEDDLVYAFLDIGPLSRGHALLIPKKCYVTLDQVPSETAAALGRVLPALVKAVMEATGAPACNVLQNNGKLAGQAVDHVHFHIIPKYDDGSGLNFDWSPRELDQDDAAKLAKEIAGKLKR